MWIVCSAVNDTTRDEVVLASLRRTLEFWSRLLITMRSTGGRTTQSTISNSVVEGSGISERLVLLVVVIALHNESMIV